MSGEDYKYQASIKFGPGMQEMLNIRSATKEEFDTDIKDALDTIGPLAVLKEAFNTEFASVSTVAAAFPGTTVENQQPAQQGGVPTCQHGVMVYKEGPDWKGHFCPAQKSDPTKCKARYIR